MASVLITGANRGLGLQFTRQYLSKGATVFATCRKPDDALELQELQRKYGDNLYVLKLDVGNSTSLEALKMELQGQSIDILINNAGIYLGRSMPFGELNDEDWHSIMSVNTFSPIHVTEKLLENVAGSERKLIVNISSKMGSIGENTSGGSYLYRSSKAALNMAVRSMAIDLKERGITSVVLHPGWVLTDMGGPNALIDVEESISGMCKVIEMLNLSDTGKFFSYNGSEIPW